MNDFKNDKDGSVREEPKTRDMKVMRNGEGRFVENLKKKP
jgi:hypothetical protein